MTDNHLERFEHSLDELIPSKRSYVIVLVLILLLSLGLRLQGVRWGLPDETHILSYHIDERNILYAIFNMNPGEFDFNPHYFIYPTFHIYLILIILKLAAVKLAPTATAILIGRLVTVFFGVLSVYIVYLLGKEFESQELGLIAASIMAITPIHVIHSHFLTTDVPVTFWILASLFFSIKCLKSGKTKWYILAGITGGLGVSTKYNAGLVILPIIAAHLSGQWKSNNKVSILMGKKIFTSLAIFVSIFLLTSPYTIIAFPEFNRDIALITVYLNSQNPEWFDTGNGLVYHLTNSLYYGLGLPLLLISLFGVASSMKKMKKETLVTLSFLIPYYLWVGNWQVRFARFILPIVPFLILFGAVGLLFILSKSKVLGAFILLGVLFHSLGLTISYNNILVSEDPRDQASSWISDNLPSNSKVGLSSQFQYFTPSLNDSRFELHFTWNQSLLKEEKIDYYIISDIEYRIYLKTKKTIERYSSESSFLDYLFNSTDYRIIKTFHNDQKFLFIDISEEYIPHDMKYANPEIVIFERVNINEVDDKNL